MNAMYRFRWIAALALVLLLLLAGSLSAQQEVGSLYGTVTDTEGSTLPGATLTLTGFGERRVHTSDDQGHFRFLGLDPGAWSLEAKLAGFSTLEYPTLEIEASHNITIKVQMSAAIEGVITVTAESPLLDERKLSTGTTARRVELEKIPTARDPWAFLPQAPGVLVNRVDVGGAESDQQPAFRSAANDFSQNEYVLDGAQITDASGGFSPTYYDFDQFQEIQYLTGGNDVTKNTAGVSINLVTKRGSNEMRGSARFLLSNDDGYFGVLKQADPEIDPNELPEGQDGFVGNSIDRVEEYGFEAGGPAWRDHLWLWGSWATNNINKRAGNNDPERFILENAAIKLNAQLSQANSFVASYNNGDKRAFGRGAGPNFDPSATFNQEGPTGITKVEDSHVFGSSLFVTGSYVHIDGGFDIRAQGGCGPENLPTPAPGGEKNIDANGYRTNNWCGNIESPSDEVKVDISKFLFTGTISHEIRFGGRFREGTRTQNVSYPGRNLVHYAGNTVGVQDPGFLAFFGLPPERFMDAHVVYAYRSGNAARTGRYRSLWAQDTLTWSQWTINLGLRYDVQDGENPPDRATANPGFPEVMPDIDFPGNDADGLEFSSLVPRIGVTYALGEERKTLVRGSLSQFPDSLSTELIDSVNPLSNQLAAILFLDEPGGFEAFYDEGEPFTVIGGLFGFDPEDPTALSSSNAIDPNIDPGMLTEIVIGVDHSFLPELVAGFNLTWRNRDKVIDRRPLFRDRITGETGTIGADQYAPDRNVFGLLPDGTPYSYDTFAADPSLISTGGELFANGVRDVDSLAAALTVTKRLANQWMLRAHLSYVFREDWSVPSDYFDSNDPNRLGPQVLDGQTFVGQLLFGGPTVQSTWSWNINGMYQVAPDRRWGFNLAANLTGRQGYPIMYNRIVPGSDRIVREIMVVDDVTDFRYGDIFVTDLRLEKEFAASGNTSLTFSIDGFNIFNENTVLRRVTNLGSGAANWVRETVSPRVWRLGVRLSWR